MKNTLFHYIDFTEILDDINFDSLDVERINEYTLEQYKDETDLEIYLDMTFICDEQIMISLKDVSKQEYFTYYDLKYYTLYIDKDLNVKNITVSYE